MVLGSALCMIQPTCRHVSRRGIRAWQLIFYLIHKMNRDVW
jgi:hypothetical protein